MKLPRRWIDARRADIVLAAWPRIIPKAYAKTPAGAGFGSSRFSSPSSSGGGTYELGIDTDASRARDHRRGQAFAQALHDTTDIDGILFDSRLTNGQCVAVFDRAFPRLTATRPVDLVRVAALAGELTRLGIVLRRKRGL